MLLPTEQARSMFLHLAACMDRAAAGDAEAAQLTRILTPLIKFRACRDARQVTQDAMEVRGGCGYIEEWSDPRIVRDALLGSIWEGTSNIVALDVARSARREATLPPLHAYLARLLADAGVPRRRAPACGWRCTVPSTSPPPVSTRQTAWKRGAPPARSTTAPAPCSWPGRPPVPGRRLPPAGAGPPGAQAPAAAAKPAGG